MRFRVALLLIACLCLTDALPGIVLAKEDPRRVQIQAAQADAVASLLDQVRAAPLTPALSIGQFLDRVGGNDRLRRVVEQNAQLIGATRWPNPGTCQVQVEVDTLEIVQALTEIARAEPKKSPLPAEVIEKRLATAWRRPTFAAHGTSATPDAVEKMRPGVDHPLWLTVSEEDRREAVQAAQRNAASETMQGLSDIPVGDGGRSLSDVLEVPGVRDAIQEWVATRPVTNIEFKDNGEVRLTVSAPGEDLWLVLKQAVDKQTDIPAPRDEAQWRRLHDEVVGRLRGPLNGRSAVTTVRGAPASRAARRMALPQQPPRWADDQMDAEGKAAGGGPPLRLTHAADVDAQKHLRAQIEALALGDGRTLGDAARQDPQIDAAIERSLTRARTHRVDWGAGGSSVTVRVSLDLRNVWQDLTRH